MSKVNPVKNIDRGRGIRTLGMDVRPSVENNDTSIIKKNLISMGSLITMVRVNVALKKKLSSLSEIRSYWCFISLKVFARPNYRKCAHAFEGTIRVRVVVINKYIIYII